MTVKWEVIRFDCRAHSNPYGAAAETALAQTDFQYRIPYPGTISGGVATINCDQQNVVDQENRWANWYGIDTWVCLLYPPDANLFLGGTDSSGTNSFYKLNYFVPKFLNSNTRGSVKFTLLLQAITPGTSRYSNTGFTANVIPYIVNLMRNSAWQTASGRPLLYVLDYGGWAQWGTAAAWAADIAALRTAVQAAGMSNPYIIGMDDYSNPTNFNLIGYDALSRYYFSPTNSPGFVNANAGSSQTGVNPYATFTSYIQNTVWATDSGRGYLYVPITSAGWDFRATMNATMQTAGYGDIPSSLPPYYPSINDATGASVAYATNDELASHIKAGIDWCTAHPSSCPAEPRIITYAWNENEEGGRPLGPHIGDGSGGLKAIARLTGRESFHFPAASGLPAFGS